MELYILDLPEQYRGSILDADTVGGCRYWSPID
jgi:hypothetical protein